MIHTVQFKNADTYAYTNEDGSFREIPQFVFVYLLMNGDYWDQICAMRTLGSIYAVEAAMSIAGTYANDGEEILVWYDDDSLVPDRFDAAAISSLTEATLAAKNDDPNVIPMIEEEDEINGFA